MRSASSTSGSISSSRLMESRVLVGVVASAHARRGTRMGSTSKDLLGPGPGGGAGSTSGSAPARCRVRCRTRWYKGPVAIEGFDELLAALREHPEWQAELRRSVLTEELLALPGVVAGLADAQRRTEERLEALTATVGALAEQVSSLAGHVVWLKGDAIERRYRERAPSYFGRIAKRLHVLSFEEVDALLDEAVTAGALTSSQADEVRWADLVARGRQADGTDVYLVVEVSWGVGVEDATRARERAELLAKAGTPTVGVVAGSWIDPDAAEAARRLGLWRVRDGYVLAPGETASG